MKILIGFKSREQADPICQLIRGLAFPDPQLKPAFVAEVWGSGISGIEPSPFNYESYLRIMQGFAEEEMRQFSDDATRLGLANVPGSVLYGNPANELMDHAEAHGFELLALGGSDASRLEQFLAGSVVRKAVANCKSSLLLAKGGCDPQNGLSIVLATDHSPHSLRWIDRFISWAPKGLKKITLVTVLPEKFLGPLPASLNHLDVSNWIKDGAEAENKRLLNKLHVLDAPCTARVEIGKVNEVLDKVMEKSQADLLVLGSQGHGFMERMTIGSVSLEQAIRHPYSVLIVRA